LALISSQRCYARSIQTHGFGTKKNKRKHGLFKYFTKSLNTLMKTKKVLESPKTI
jgi:hypothetical protein